MHKVLGWHAFLTPVFTWNGEITPSDILAGLALSAAAATALVAYRQLRIGSETIESVRTQLAETAVTNRARFLFDLMRWYLDNAELQRMFQRLDYRDWKFDEKTFSMSDDERWIDYILFAFDVFGHLIELGVLRDDELSVIEFDTIRVLENPEIIRYLKWLDDEFKSVGLGRSAFWRARKLAERIRSPVSQSAQV
jgi:hypothetical protein